jgi:hypothetical protein
MKFNESIKDIVQDCKYILIDLADDGVPYKTSIKKSTSIDDNIVIDIIDYDKGIELKKYVDNFNHLFDYLESLGYVLSKSSYYCGDNWDAYERCPECNSTGNITMINSDALKCNDCGHEALNGEFSSPDYPLNKSELMWSAKVGDKPTLMYLEFKKGN